MSQLFEPTPRRLRRARAEGDLPTSSAVGRAAALLAVLLLGGSAARAAGALFTEQWNAALAAPDTATASGMVGDVALLVLPLVATAAALALAAGLAQTGGRFVPWTRRLRAGRWRPLDGRRGAAACRAAIAATLVLFVAIRGLATGAPDVARAMGGSASLPGAAVKLLRDVGWALFAVLAIAALLELVLATRAWRARLRMTWSELKDERRESERALDVGRDRRLRVP